MFGEYQDDGLVFCQRNGLPMDPQNFLNRHFRDALQRAGLPPVRFHTCCLRGTTRRWSRNDWGIAISMTIDTYSHLLPGPQAEAATAFDAAIQGKKKGRRTISPARRLGTRLQPRSWFEGPIHKTLDSAGRSGGI